MIDAIVELVHTAMSSPWIYVVLFALSAIDGFLPVVPSESVVITAGAFAASGVPNVFLVMAFAAAGAFVGDHISYFIGRVAGHRLFQRFPAGSRRRKAYDTAAKVLHDRGGLILVVARYVPGGRTAMTITAGAVGYPLRKFSFFDSIAAVSWGIYSGLVGYLGGVAFEEEPLKGVLLGLGLALSVTAVVEIVRFVRRRSHRAEPEPVRVPEPVDAGVHSG